MADVMDVSVWRHPKPPAAAVVGRCIGRTDVGVDPRKAKRLAHRLRAWARRHGTPHVVITSPLRRGADVGRWLVRWGWTHRIDARLSEVDFGAWEGQTWDAIGAAAVGAWCDDFGAHEPGGGESVRALLLRCAAFVADQRAASAAPGACIVGHAGWISAALWLQRANVDVDAGAGAGAGAPAPAAATWPRAVGYGVRVRLRL